MLKEEIKNISQKNCWFKADNYTFVDDDLIGVDLSKSTKLSSSSFINEYDLWAKYKYNKKNLNKNNINPHILLHEIGKLANFKDNSENSKIIQELLLIEKRISEYLKDNKDDELEEKQIDFYLYQIKKILKKNFILNEVILESYEDLISYIKNILEKYKKKQKKYLKEKILDWINRFGITGEFFSTVTHTVLPPQWLPYDPVNSDYARQFLDLTIIKNEKKNDNLAFFEYNEPEDDDKEKIRTIEQSVAFFPSHINKISSNQVKINVACFQPHLVIDRGKFYYFYKLIPLKKIVKDKKKIEEFDKSFFADQIIYQSINNPEKRILKNEILNELNNFKNYIKPGFYKRDEYGELVEIKKKFFQKIEINNFWCGVLPPGYLDINYCETTVKYIKIYWSYMIESYETVELLAKLVFGIFETSEKIFSKKSLKKDEVSDLLLLDRISSFFLEDAQVGYVLKNHNPNINHFTCNGLKGFIGLMIQEDNQNSGKILQWCKYRNCEKPFYTKPTKKLKLYCSPEHANCERVMIHRLKKNKKIKFKSSILL